MVSKQLPNYGNAHVESIGSLATPTNDMLVTGHQNNMSKTIITGLQNVQKIQIKMRRNNKLKGHPKLLKSIMMQPREVKVTPTSW